MFEVTIRTDNQAALQKVMEFLASLDLQMFKGAAPNGKKFIFEFPEKTPTAPSGVTDKKKIVQWGGMEVDISNVTPGFGGAKGMIELSPDWDEPLEDFKEYM